MSKWLFSLASKCQQIALFEPWTDDCIKSQMLSKPGLIVFFVVSLSFALILSLVPNLAALWLGTRQLLTVTFSTPTSSSFVVRRQNSAHFDLCSRPFDLKQAVGPQLVSIQSSGAEGSGAVMQRNINANKADLVGEALSAIHIAREMVSHGKIEKASKLYQHAMALCPSHPDVLTGYGEFLEHHGADVLSAEHMYCRALINNPSHTKALDNRKRTLPLVEEIDQSYFNVIDRKRELLLGIPENHPGIKRMMQESYFRHIYHTTAIEGNTFTLSQTRMLVETRMAIGGKSVMEHNEILGMDSAFTFVNNSLMHRLGSLASQDILNIHKRVLGYVDPVSAGELRTTQVFVGDHEPPPASEVSDLMSEFIDWLNSEEALSMHPIELAALAHYKLVWIHPFFDGNGRTSRLLMNLIMMQAGYPPIIIKVEEKHTYYQHLQTANDGDVRPFIRFIAKCTERAIDEFLLAGLENARSLISALQLQKDDDGRTIIIQNTREHSP